MKYFARFVKKTVWMPDLRLMSPSMTAKCIFTRTLSLSLCLAACHGLQAGYEIADLTQAYQDGFRGYTRVYLDYGANPITSAEWPTYTPSPGYIKNTPRNPEFNAENTFSSPGLSDGQVDVVTIDGYTWKFIAQIQSAMWPYDSSLFPETLNAYQAAFATTTPPAGTIKFSSNEKNQEMIFWAREGNSSEGAPILRYFITDQWGNKYIMGASGAATDEEIPASFASTVLPEGWTKSTGYLDETLSLMPAYSSGGQAHYNIFRESGDNTFFQIEWGESGHGIAQQIAGMPIWGGATNDQIIGRAGDDNLIFGAEGDDLIFSLGQNDIIHGDAGIDTVVFGGNFSDYSILSYANDGAELTLWGFGYQKHLFDVEFLRFDDQTIATSSVPEPSVFALLAGGAFLFLHLRRRPCCVE